MSAQRSFTLSTPAPNVRADAEGGAEIVYTVANTSGLPNRGLARIVPLGDTRAEWLGLEGQNERDFPAGGIHQFTVSAKLPPGAAGRYSLRLDMLSARKGGEEAYAGPVVTIETTATAAPAKASRWWLWAAAIVLLLIVGVAGALVMRDEPQGEPVADLTDTVATAVTETVSTVALPETVAPTETAAPPPADIYLSELEPTIRHEPHGGLTIGKTYWGTPIVVGGKTHENGLAMHARPDGLAATVEYQVPAGVRFFRATVGIVEPCPTSSVLFGVWVNGQPRFTSDVLRGSEQQSVPAVAVSEGDVLALAVGNGGDGHDCDHAAWAGARFAR